MSRAERCGIALSGTASTSVPLRRAPQMEFQIARHQRTLSPPPYSVLRGKNQDSGSSGLVFWRSVHGTSRQHKQKPEHVWPGVVWLLMRLESWMRPSGATGGCAGRRITFEKLGGTRRRRSRYIPMTRSETPTDEQPKLKVSRQGGHSEYRTVDEVSCEVDRGLVT